MQVRGGSRVLRGSLVVVVLASLLAFDLVSTADPAAAADPFTDRLSPPPPTGENPVDDQHAKTATNGAYTAITRSSFNQPDQIVLHRTGASNLNVSRSPGNQPGNGPSLSLDISADGRWVLFASLANNLVAGDTNGTWDLFVWDRLLAEAGDIANPNRIRRVSLAHDGGQLNVHITNGAISDNGTKVVFSTTAANVVPGDTNGVSDVFLRDLAVGTTTRVSLTNGGGQAQGGSSIAPAISGNGNVVAFASAATNLVPGVDTGGDHGIYVRRLQSPGTEYLTTTVDGEPVDGPSLTPALSLDGRFVAFESEATNLVPGDENDLSDVFVRDRTTGLIERMSVSDVGQEGDDESYNASISADGRFVAFDSLAGNLVGDHSLGSIDINLASDVFVRDRLGRVTERASLNRFNDETEWADVQNGHISPDGRYVVFDTDQDEWQPLNDDWDNFKVYRRDRGDMWAGIGGRFTGVQPTRLLDTRFGPTPGGWPAGTSLNGATSRNQINVQVAGVQGIPSNATAVVLNVTSTEASTANGYLTVWPFGETRPNTSSLNLQPGANVPNLVTVKVGSQNRVSIWTNTGTVHAIVDIFGYYAPDAGDGFESVQPTRLLDTRSSPVPPGWTPGNRLIGGNAAREKLDLEVAGVADVPADATAVVLNITSTQATTNSAFVTAWPSGEPRPNTSNLNLQVGYNVPNLAVVKVGTGRKVSLYTNTGQVHLIADLVGYYTDTASKRFFGLNPGRILDTRSPNPVKSGPFGPGQSVNMPVAGRGGVPVTAQGVVMNVTSTEATSAGGYTTVWPALAPQPPTSNLNYRPGINVPNLVQVGLGDQGRVGLFNGAGTVHLISDVTGYFR
jgi:Tol biopolymer transport system component